MKINTCGACVLWTTGTSGCGESSCALRREFRHAFFLCIDSGCNTAGEPPPYPLASFEPSVLLALSSNPADSPQSMLLLAPLALPPVSVVSLPSHLQYVLQYSQSALRVANTVMLPSALQPGTTSALYAPAPLLS